MTNITNLSSVRFSKGILRFQQCLAREHIYCETDLETYYDHAMNCLVMQLVAYVTRGEHDQIGLLDVPATWWDAFKLEYFPAWARTRWPVQYKGLRYIQTIRLCPHANIDWGNREHIEFLCPEMDPSWKGMP